MVNDARIHASYMLGSTIRKATQRLCDPDAMQPQSNVQSTRTLNKSAHAFRAN